MFQRQFYVVLPDGTEKYEDDNSATREEGRKLVEAKYPNATRINCVAERNNWGPEDSRIRNPKYWEPGYGPPID